MKPYPFKYKKEEYLYWFNKSPYSRSWYWCPKANPEIVHGPFRYSNLCLQNIRDMHHEKDQ